MKKYLYGFKNKKTGLFKSWYNTSPWNTKMPCFKRKGNAEKALKAQEYKDDYIVTEMVEIDE